MSKPSRIISNPEILGGTPVVEGTHIPAANILAEIHEGTEEYKIFDYYSSLPSDGIGAYHY